MSIWKLFEKATTPVLEQKKVVVVPTIVVTPVLEESEEYLERGYAEDTPSPSTTPKKDAVVEVVEVLPSPSPTEEDESTRGLGISGVPTTPPYTDPLIEVDDLLQILGLDIEEEKDTVEDEVERILEGLEANASKLVHKSKVQFLELSREWKAIVEREYLPAKREAKMVIYESYAMEEFKKRNVNDKEALKISRDDRLFSAIVLADAAKPACLAAVQAAQKINNLQTLALEKYATRLKDHKILPLATYRRYVRRVKRMEREMEGWKGKRVACGRILVVGEKVLNDMSKEEAGSSADSGYGE